MKYFLILIALVSFQSKNGQNQFLDANFGTNNGYSINQLGDDDFSFSSVIEVNNAIYAIHSTLGGASFISKYNLNGIIDSDFGTNGFIPINNLGVADFSLFTGVKKLVASSDGKLFITSSSSAVVGGQQPNSIITKLNLDGTFDSSYGFVGQVLTNYTYGQVLIGSYKYPNDEILLVQNKQTISQLEPELSLLKVDNSGNLDATFGSNGRIVLPNDYGEFYPKLARVQDQFIYIYFTSNDASDYIKKYVLETTSYDETFGNNGKLIIDDAYAFQESISFLIDPNDDIFVVGYETNQSQNLQIKVSKFTNENLNVSFGTNGISQPIITTTISGVYSIEKHGDKIIIVAENYSATNSEGATFLAQLNSDGTLDSNFGINGIIRNENFDDLNLAFDYIYSEDSIITSGLCPSSGGEYRPCLIKYITNNTLALSTATKSNLSFYPNPVENVLYFQSDEEVNTIKVFDVVGRLIRSKTVYNNSIDISELASGNYVITAESANTNYTLKVLKK